MKVLIVSPSNSISDSSYSHRAAPARIYCNQLRELGYDAEVDFKGKVKDLSPYDRVYIYHADNGTSRVQPIAFNIFGGFQRCPYSHNVIKFSKIRNKTFSLNCTFNIYERRLRRKYELAVKAGVHIEPEWHALDFDNMKRMENESPLIQHINPTKKFILGDSHAISLYRPGWSFNSIVYKTLNGALNIGLKNLIDIQDVEELELYFGNIDIRHHLCRLPGDPLKHTEELADRYITQAKELNAKIYELLPIENESRVVPKMGWYDGKPFHGSWSERKKVRDHFNDYIESKYGIIRWTDYLLNTDGELDQKFMEKPRSIHLAPKHYPFWNGEQIKQTSNDLTNFYE